MNTAGSTICFATESGTAANVDRALNEELADVDC